jgi:16S rRNA processing protein RimM
VDGSIAVTPFSDKSAALVEGAELLAGEARYTVTRVRKAGGGLVLTFKEVATPEEADKLRGATLETLASLLPPTPEGVYYHYQIIGSLVVTPGGKALGRVKEIIETPGNDVYVVVPESGGSEIMVPALRGVIKDVNIRAGVITVAPPEGL